MIVLDRHEAFAELCRATGKWGVWVHFGSLEGVVAIGETLKAAPYLNIEEHGQLLSDGGGVILCEGEAECRRIFGMTVGDDGPTALNPYNGPFRVYALTCDPSGQLLNENT